MSTSMGSLWNKLLLTQLNTNNKHAHGASPTPAYLVMVLPSMGGSRRKKTPATASFHQRFLKSMLSSASEPYDNFKKKLSHMADLLVYNCPDSRLESTIVSSSHPFQVSSWGALIDHGINDSPESGGVSSSALCNATVSAWRI